MIKFCVVFDFDGVVIHSKEVQRKAFTESCKILQCDGNPSFEEFLSHSGNSLPAIFEKMNLPREMVELYQKISRENIHQITIAPGMKKLLLKLKTEGFFCGLCTGKDRLRTIEILKFLNLYDYFDCIVCSDDVVEPKPAPESLMKLLNELDISYSNAAMVGDAVNDILCAQSLSVTSIAVGWGDGLKRDILEVNPHFFVDNIEELESCIDSLVLPEING
ncbi:MAG: HAD family hydrolase [Marinifilaceae bacterium]